MVFVTGIRQNTNHMFGGVNDVSWTGFSLFLLAMAILVAAWLVVSPFTIRYARLVQRTGMHDRLAHRAGRGLGPPFAAN
jgi:hypothetical protein